MFRFLTISFFSFFFFNTVASAASPCPDALDHRKNLQVQRNYDAFANACFVSIDPFTTLDLIYRSFLVENDGILMVFNSYGEGPNSTHTGAREYYLFPRKGMPDFSFDSDDLFTLTLASGGKVQFRTEDMKMLSFEGANFREDSSINRENNGGLEISQFQGILLDVGFKLGSDPADQASKKSMFSDARGAQCELQNSEIFSYAVDGSGDIKFKFLTDAKLADFLTDRCANLDLSSLK